MRSSTAARVLADYAAGLRGSEIPGDVLRLARLCVIDSVAAAVSGHDSSAGRIVAEYAGAQPSGRCTILGWTMFASTENAALANGTLAHSLELDSLRKPGAGVHPGAVLVPAALAVAQEMGASGRDLLEAVVAGCEVLFRVGRATKHSAETRGFHAPGLTGPFGAAVVAGRLLGLGAEAMANALGIAGSMSAGLLEFAASGSGGMVKRLHLGRAAAAGIQAARLAQAGFTGPASVLEGAHGFLHGFCAETDETALTGGLGEQWESRRICFKSFACHITAHTPVYAVLGMMAEHGFAAADVAGVVVQGTPKMAALHAGQHPADAVAAQYSIAFCVAASLLHNPRDPATFIDGVRDQAVLDLCRRVEVRGESGFASNWATRTTVRLHDGRSLQAELDEVPGMPELPFTDDQMGAKFLALTRKRLGGDAPALLARLESLEAAPALSWLDATPRRANVDA